MCAVFGTHHERNVKIRWCVAKTPQTLNCDYTSRLTERATIRDILFGVPVMRHVVGWLFLIVGTFAAFAEPHSGTGCIAIAGAILLAAERIAVSLSQRIPS